MLTIIFNWFYILSTTFCLGFAFRRFVEKMLRYTMKRMDSIFVAGLVIATVYAQIFSLFFRVSAEANLVLVAICAVICVVWRKQIWVFLRETFQKTPRLSKICIVFVFFVWAYFTSRGSYIVLDMDLYHGQSIRWIEEYGVVKGLGNLHSRFGYNSSIFAVSALYSMKFLLGQSLHTVNGLIAFFLSLTALDLRKCFQQRKMRLSDYARVGMIYYLTTIWDEILAPSSDYAVMCIIFFIVIKWLAQLEAEDEESRNNITPYGLLCVVGVYTLTLKLSAGLILILTLKPAIRLLREKRWKEIFVYLTMGLLVAVPWMARTVIITGWLFYPMASLDLFSVDWKIADEGIIRTDTALIKTWAKKANGIGINATLREWFPGWFQALYSTEKLLVLIDLVCCVIIVGIFCVTFVKRHWESLDKLLVFGTVMASYLFWQLYAPMMRYGYAHVLLLCALTVGFLMEKWRLTAKAAYSFLLVYGIYKLSVGCYYIYCYRELPYYLWQQTYGTHELESYEIDGNTFYYSPYGGVTGYDPFPSSPTFADIELRGDGLKDGFRAKQSED